MMRSKPVIRVVWTAVVILALIGTAAAIRRTLLIGHFIPETNPPNAPAGFDRGFAGYPALTLLHVLPGLLFMVLAPLQFAPRFRARHIVLHRWSGRLLVAAAAVVGITALRMSFAVPVGGNLETAATITFGLLFLFFLAKGLVHARRREIAVHREWMLRMFAVGFAIATIRPIVALFFAFSGMTPQQFFGIAFWIGFSLHVIVAEVWIRATRTRRRVSTVRPDPVGELGYQP
jgi:hypothetical protein